MEDKEYSIYRFKDPRDQQIIYIGLTSDPERRYREHISKGGTLYPIAQELAAEGLQLIFEIIEKVTGLKNAFKLERDYIRHDKPLLNIIHNTTGYWERKEFERRREALTEAMEAYHFTHREAVLWHYAFFSSEGDWYTYKIIKRTAIEMQQRLQGESTLTESDILELALDITNFYETWESTWDKLWRHLSERYGVEE